MKKRILSLLLTLCLMLSLTVVPVSAASPAVYSAMSDSYKSGPYYKALMSVNLTGNQITDLINVARSQVGYHAGSSASDLSGTSKTSKNYVEFFNRISPKTQGKAWCATFVTWCFREAGIPTSIMPSATGCGKVRNSVKNQGATYHSLESGYKPKKGDIILYESMGGNYTYYQVAKRDANGLPSSTSHVGIVSGDYNSSTNKFRTIQRDDAVVREFDESMNTWGWNKDKTVKIKRIQGFVTPAYTNTTSAADPVLTMYFNANGGAINSDTFSQDGSGNIRRGGSNVQVKWTRMQSAPETGLWNAASFGLSRDGYTFLGWSLSRDGSSTVFDQDDTSVTGGTIYPGLNKDTTVTLYAVWSQKPNYLQCNYNFSGINYLLNSDFSGSLDEAYWMSRDTGVATLSVDRSNTHNGYSSLRISNASAGSSGKDLGFQTLTMASKANNNYVGDQKSMTLSFWAKCSVPGTGMHFRWGYEGTGYRSVTLSTDWQKYSVRMDKLPDYNNWIHPYVDTAGTVWLAELQLEDGSSATEFVPENGGVYQKTVQSPGGYYSLPEDPSREGYIFDGWCTTATGGPVIDGSSVVEEGSLCVYAVWIEDEPEYEPEEMGSEEDISDLIFDTDPEEETPEEPAPAPAPEKPAPAPEEPAPAPAEPAPAPEEPAPSAPAPDGGSTIIMQIDNPVMIVNGKVTPVDERGNTPVIRNSRTMLPVSSLILAMGGTVKWDGTTQTVTLEKNGKVLNLRIGTNFAWDDSGKIAANLDSPPIIINGRTMLPVAAIVLYYGAGINWDGSTRTVTITY